MPGALDGILVVSLEQAVAAPFCTQKLAEAGARVIKIERADGDFARNYDHVVHGESAYFAWLNHGKQSLVLDIKHPGDCALLDRLLSNADVFVQNLAPGAAARAGFGSDILRARHARLITCDISGYGEEGPARDMKAYDFLIQCEAGLAAVTGAPDAPCRVGVSVADIACGMNAHAAILQALFERTSTGVGRGISVSLFDGLAEWMTVPLLHHDYGGKAPLRQGMQHPSIAPYGAFNTKDGKAVVISVQNEREWQIFCTDVLQLPDALDNADFANNSSRVANRVALDEMVATTFAGLSQAEAIARLSRAQIAYGSFNEVADLSLHSQLRRKTVASATGPIELPASPVRWNDDEPACRTLPVIDSHGAKIREEFA